jgi:cobalt-zinc-cadmium efflux system membrane fusion protein
MKMNRLFYLIAFAILISSCTKKNESQKISDYKTCGDTIVISNGSSILEKIKTETINKINYNFELTTSGAVEAIPNNYAQIAPPFAGRITKSCVRLGQKVKAGTPVFEISSPSFYETGKAYYQAKQEMELAEKNFKREKDLLSKNVGVQKDVEEAEVNFELKKKEYENALASLKVYQINPKQLVLGQPLIVRSPIDGIIVDNKIVIGQYVKEDAEPVATVAQLNKIWVKAQVKEKDIRFIRVSDKVDVKPVSFPDVMIKGSIYHVNNMLDEETRSVGVIVECDNSNMLMKPGMYVAVNFHNSINNSIIIPSKAIFQLDDNCFVFVSVGDNKYIKRKITTLSVEKDKTIVETGLNIGDKIIVEGGIYFLDEE